MNSSDAHFSPRYWVIVPAAGIGARMGAAAPKQYLTLHNQTILDHTLERLLRLPQLAGLYLALQKTDSWWPASRWFNDPRIIRVDGGQERSASVLNALNALAPQAHKSDWVLVHDAARPCVKTASIQRLCEQLAEHDVGGILALPVTDTLKKVNQSNGITGTIDRRELWQAQTPQMFRFELLRRCLMEAAINGLSVTDEASALEAFGYVPQVVEGRSDNIKITRQEDMLLANFIMQQQEMPS